MVSFSSLEFIFRFLPIFLIVYFATPVKYKDIALLAGSLIFYAFGEPVLFLYLFLPHWLIICWGGRHGNWEKVFWYRIGRTKNVSAW